MPRLRKSKKTWKRSTELDLSSMPSQFETNSEEIITQPLSSLNFQDNSGPPQSAQSSGPESLSSSQVSVHHHTGVQFTPLPLHNLQGRNIRINTDRSIAVRLMEEYCNAFVFTSRPVRFGETLVIQVLGIDRSYIGGLGFGLTACDPSLVQPASLPDDSDLLLDRPEYWVVNKDVCRNPEVGDELSFFISSEGEVRYARNNQAAVTLMHVDRTLPLWAFFDVYGNVQKIKVLGSTMNPIQGHLPRSQTANTYSNIPNLDGSPTATGGGCYPHSSPAFSVAMPPYQWPQRHGSAAPTSLSLTFSRSNSVPEPHQNTAIDASSTVPPHSSVPTTPAGTDNSQEDNGECRVCCERAVNCVLYTCGHMCLCYTCANVIRQQRGECPICRQRITDIIKVFRS